MASLTIPFPEGTRTITLRGKRITIGRLPDNTIQIRDRTVSAYHVELVAEGDHYRLHDKDSTNAVLVGGQRVSDYHLREDCQVSFGSVACEFKAATKEEPESEADAIPSRGEMLTILQANGDLRVEVAALRSQVEAMLKAREAGETAGKSVPLEQHDQLAAETAALRASLQERQTQIERLTSLLSIVTRERDTLQKGYDDARAALERARQNSNASAPSGAKPENGTKPASAAPASAPKAPSVPTPNGAKPPVPSAAPVMPPAPAVSAAPKAPVTAAAPVPPSAPIAKPLPKPPGALGSGSPSRRPASGLTPAAPRAAGATSRVPAGAAMAGAGIGPKGTQKLME